MGREAIPRGQHVWVECDCGPGEQLNRLPVQVFKKGDVERIEHGTGCCIPQAIGLSVGCVSNYVRGKEHVQSRLCMVFSFQGCWKK